MDFWILLGAIGSVASIVGVALPTHPKHQRWIHATYGLVIAILAAVAVWYWSQSQRVKQVERAANVLIAERNMEYTHQGFIQASLAFLEKNRDLYPDSYTRAQRLCEVNNCLSADSSTHDVNAAFALQGLLKGIGTIESNRSLTNK